MTHLFAHRPPPAWCIFPDRNSQSRQRCFPSPAGRSILPLCEHPDTLGVVIPGRAGALSSECIDRICESGALFGQADPHRTRCAATVDDDCRVHTCRQTGQVDRAPVNAGLFLDCRTAACVDDDEFRVTRAAGNSQKVRRLFYHQPAKHKRVRKRNYHSRIRGKSGGAFIINIQDKWPHDDSRRRSARPFSASRGYAGTGANIATRRPAIDSWRAAA